MPRSQAANSRQTILLACVIPRFCQSVGIQKNRVTVRQSQAMNLEARIAEHSQRHSGGILWLDSLAVDVKKRKMARVDKLDCAIVCGSPHDKCCELPGQSAFAENAVGAFHHAIKRQAGLGETAKGRMQMTHEHGRRHALAGDVPQHEEQSAFCFYQVAVVAAHHASGLIVEANVPAFWRQSAVWQQAALDARGKRE